MTTNEDDDENAEEKLGAKTYVCDEKFNRICCVCVCFSSDGCCYSAGFIWIFATAFLSLLLIIKTNFALGFKYHIIRLNYIYVWFLQSKGLHILTSDICVCMCKKQEQICNKNAEFWFFGEPLGEGFFLFYFFSQEEIKQIKVSVVL